MTSRYFNNKILTHVLLLLVVVMCCGCMTCSVGSWPPYKLQTWSRLNDEEMHINVISDHKPFSVGTAKVDITPPLGTPLAGFGRRKGKPSKGILDPLYARALVAQSEDKIIAWVSLDMMAVHEELFYAVLAELDDDLKIEPKNLFLMASHTHSGSGALAKQWVYEKVSGRFNEDLFYTTVSKIAAAIKTAAATTFPSKWGAETINATDINLNRMKESGPTDTEIVVIRVERTDGTPIAFMANLAVHPTILGSSNFKFSADFPGELTRKIEETYPNSVCMFINGASADLKPQTKTQPTDAEEAKEFGSRMADKIIQVADSIKTSEAEKVCNIGVAVRLPPVRFHYGKWLSLPWVGNGLLDRDSYMNAVIVDDIVFLSVPGELSVEIGNALQEEIRRWSVTPVICGYTNDYNAYMLEKKDYRLKEYESLVSFYGPYFGSYMKDILLREARMLTVEAFSE